MSEQHDADVQTGSADAIDDGRHADSTEPELAPPGGSRIEAYRAEAHDERVDAELDLLDDGSGITGAASGPARPEALPFVLTTRQHFAAVGDVEVTGDARVDAATARLEEVPDLPTADHVAVYDDVHRRLQDALSDADVR